MFGILKPERANWRHYFGSLAVLLLIVQLVTGVVLTLFYEPTLKDAYKSVQHLTNHVFGGSLSRNFHRWAAFVLFAALIIHSVRSIVRKDFINAAKRVEWLTGVALTVPVFFLIYTGLVLPWEWKGYWFMEMVPSYAATFPVAGPALKAFFLNEFTLARTLVIHILLLPIVCFILVDYHFFTKLKKRGIFRHIARHTLISLPLIAGLVVLSIYVTIPSEDPEVIPLPLEGAYIPAPEWYGLTLLLPFFYFRGGMVALLSVYVPVVLLFVVGFMPYYLGRKGSDAAPNDAGGLSEAVSSKGILSFLMRGAAVAVIVAVIFGFIYRGSYVSPTLGCNSCHSLASGMRMGTPPETFRDRKTLPNLDNDKWMMGHWFYPNEIY